MSHEEIFASFFSGSFEAEYNQRLMYRDYKLPSEEIFDYLHKVMDIPLYEFMDAIITKYSTSHFSTKDIPQFSSFNDATNRICNILKDKGDDGYKYEEIGAFLRIADVERNSGANLKYGENHCKIAADFGLVQIRVGKVCYLSCFGMIYNDLSESEKHDYLSRFVLRNNFINWLINKAAAHEVNLEEEMSILSPSTIKRRKPNVKYYLDLLKGQNDSQIDSLLSNIQ